MNRNIRVYNRHPVKKIDARYIRNAAAAILKLLELNECSIEITFCEDAFMRRQNLRHMKKRSTTDVLSFPHHQPQKKTADYQGLFLGDVLINMDQAVIQARQQRITPRREALFLLLHSILHLIGHDHGRDTEKLRMQREESRIWLALINSSY